MSLIDSHLVYERKFIGLQVNAYAKSNPIRTKIHYPRHDIERGCGHGSKCEGRQPVSFVGALVYLFLILAVGSLLAFMFRLGRIQSIKLNVGLLGVIGILIFMLILMSRIITSLLGIVAILVVLIIFLIARKRT